MTEVVAPAGWAVKPLRDCVDILDRLRKPVNGTERATRLGSVPYYGATGQVGWIDEPLFNEELILLGEDGAPFLDKSRQIAYLIAGPSWVNNHAHVLRAREGVTSNRYIKYYLDYFDFTDYVQGSTRDKLNQSAMKEIPVLVAPLAVQGRVVDLIELMGSSLDSALVHVTAAYRAIHRFRQAVLTDACSGRLTADWREPRGLGEWPTEAAATVCAKVQSGKTPKQWYDGSDGVPFLKVYNVVDQKLAFEHRPQFISPELFHGVMARTEAKPGDVLMNIVGPPLGKVAIVTDKYPEWSINQALTLFRPGSRVTTEWLYLFLCSGLSVAGVMSATKGTVGQINISLTQCREFDIPLPTIEEQQEVARRVADLFALADHALDQVGSAADRVKRTSQAVLAKAFLGHLTGY